MTLIQANNPQAPMLRMSIGTGLQAAFEYWANLDRRHRNWKHLQSLTDRELRDIGISRAALTDM